MATLFFFMIKRQKNERKEILNKKVGLICASVEDPDHRRKKFGQCAEPHYLNAVPAPQHRIPPQWYSKCTKGKQ
jgi:hypothetical protein